MKIFEVLSLMISAVFDDHKTRVSLPTRHGMYVYIMLPLTRCAAIGGTGDMPPTLKSRGTSYALVPPPTFTTTFILICWSPLHTHHRSSAPIPHKYVHTYIHTHVHCTSYSVLHLDIRTIYYTCTKNTSLFVT